MPYGVNMDADEFYRRLQQNEELKKKLWVQTLKTHCQNLKEETKNASDFSSAQQVIAEVYVALLSSFEGKAKEALVQRLNENATMLTNATENRSAFLRSIKTK
ncbi:phage protein [Bacillus subtilis]|nr:phage protein [Bacillus subtilis]